MEATALVQPSEEQQARETRKHRMRVLRSHLVTVVDDIYKLKDQLHTSHVELTPSGPKLKYPDAQYGLLKLKGEATLLCTEIAAMRGKTHCSSQIMSHFPVGCLEKPPTYTTHVWRSFAGPELGQHAARYADVLVARWK